MPLVLNNIDDLLEELVKQNDLFTGAVEARDLHVMQEASAKIDRLRQLAWEFVKNSKKVVVQ